MRALVLYLGVYVLGYVCECVYNWMVCVKESLRAYLGGKLVFGVCVGGVEGLRALDVSRQWSVWRGAPGWHV